MPDFIRRIPEGDNRERLVCPDCGHIAYENPKIVVGSVVVADGAVLLCRRAIPPRLGYWTLPAGYLELGETLQEGAAREAMEEAQADIALDGILGVFSIARIGQVQVIFRARFTGGTAPLRRRAGKPGGGVVRVGQHPVGRDRLPVRALGAGRLAPARPWPAGAAGGQSASRRARHQGHGG